MNTPKNHKHSATYWFAMLDIAIEENREEECVEALNNLSRLGFKVGISRRSFGTEVTRNHTEAVKRLVHDGSYVCHSQACKDEWIKRCHEMYNELELVREWIIENLMDKV